MSKGRLSSVKLQRALDGLARARNQVSKFREQIALHCHEVYGRDPADVDNDDFIDACDGGCGTCFGMSAEEFHLSMIDAMKRSGVAAKEKGE